MKKFSILLILLTILLPIFGRAEVSFEKPTGVSISPGSDTATISWNNPDNTTFSKVILFHSTIPIEKYFTYEAVEGLCDKIYEGTKETFMATGLAENLAYYFILFASDQYGNYSNATVLLKEPYEEGQEVKKETTTNTLAGASAEVVNEVSFDEAGIVYNFNQKSEAVPGSNTARLSLFIIVKSPHDLSTKDKNAISHFVDQGTPTTILLGAGERTGVLNSYLSVFDKLPTDQLEWQDVIKIANGRWPNQRSIESEEKASDELFSAIYKRPADMDNSFDNAAVTVIAYGLRPANRNLESENSAIKIFRSIFDKDPIEAYEWDMVRAIAYSGATR